MGVKPELRSKNLEIQLDQCEEYVQEQKREEQIKNCLRTMFIGNIIIVVILIQVKKKQILLRNNWQVKIDGEFSNLM